MKLYPFFFALALCQVSSLFAEANNYIIYEDFARFDVGSKPPVFWEKMEIKEDLDGSHFGHCTGGATPLIGELDMLDPGGSDYTYRIRFRFPDPKQIAGPLLSFVSKGTRKEVPYTNYQLRIDKDIIRLFANCDKNATVKPPDIEPFKSATPIEAGKWIELDVCVEPERLRVSGDLFGNEEVYFDVKIPYGTGEYGGTSMCPMDVKYVIVTDNNKKQSASSFSRGDDVGPTDAASQAEKVAQ